MKKGQRILDCKDAELGQLMKAMRIAKGKNQTELAAAIGIGRTSVTNMERGCQAVTLMQLVKAGELCGFDVRLRIERSKKNGK